MSLGSSIKIIIASLLCCLIITLVMFFVYNAKSNPIFLILGIIMAVVCIILSWTIVYLYRKEQLPTIQYENIEEKSTFVV